VGNGKRTKFWHHCGQWQENKILAPQLAGGQGTKKLGTTHLRASEKEKQDCRTRAEKQQLDFFDTKQNHYNYSGGGIHLAVD
jgi:hypothetical protein